MVYLYARSQESRSICIRASYLKFSGGWREAAIEVIGFRTLASAIHSIGMEEWKYALCLIKVGSNFVSGIVIRLISVRPGLSIFGVATRRHPKMSRELLLHSVTQGFSVSSFLHYDVGGVTRSPCILIHNIKKACSVREGLSGKVIRKMDMVVRLEEQCAMGCKGKNQR